MTQSMTADEWNARRARANVGQAAHAAGRAFESDLEWTHGKYRLSGVADIFKLPVATQPMPRTWLVDPKRFGTARILAERQRADYIGALGLSAGESLLGRCIAMEAKYTSQRAASLPIIAEDKTGSGVKAHQLKALVEGARFGTIGVVVWRNGHERLVFLPNLLEWAWNQFRLGKINRIYPVDASPYERTGDGGNAIEDWIRPVLVSVKQVAQSTQTPQ